MLHIFSTKELIRIKVNQTAMANKKITGQRPKKHKNLGAINVGGQAKTYYLFMEDVFKFILTNFIKDEDQAREKMKARYMDVRNYFSFMTNVIEYKVESYENALAAISIKVCEN